jgi:hypothetical protein
MAPRGPAKRQSKPVEVVPEKRRKKEVDPLRLQCDLVVAALEEAVQVPPQVRQMLIDFAPATLTVPKEERHEFQDQAISMLSQALAGVDHDMEESVAQHEAKVNAADSEMANRQEAVLAADASVVAKQSAMADQKAVVASDMEARDAAQQALTESLSLQTSGDMELNAAIENKEKLEGAMKDVYTPLKLGESDKATTKKYLASLASTCKEFKIDKSLMSALPGALNKPTESRSSFEAVILQQFESEISKSVDAFQACISEGAPAKEARASAVQAAQATYDAAEEKYVASSGALDALAMELKACEKSVREAKRLVKDFTTERAQDISASDEAKSRFNSFRSGALLAFNSLKDRSNNVAATEKASGDSGIVGKASGDLATEPADMMVVMEHAPPEVSV